MGAIQRDRFQFGKCNLGKIGDFLRAHRAAGHPAVDVARQGTGGGGLVGTIDDYWKFADQGVYGRRKGGWFTDLVEPSDNSTPVPATATCMTSLAKSATGCSMDW